MNYHIDKKNLMAGARILFKSGGQKQKAANTIYSILTKIEDSQLDPFQGIPLTKHGESRIPKCRKYDLPGRCRLITVVDSGHCYLVFAGDHNACDKWLESNRGYVPILGGDGKFTVTHKSPNTLADEERISGKSDNYLDRPLFEFLRQEDYEKLVEGLSASQKRWLESLETISEEAELLELCSEVNSGEQRVAIYDVFSLMRQGKIDRAKSRLDLYLGRAKDVSKGDSVLDGEEIRAVRANTRGLSDNFRKFVEQSDYKEWMLFMHPEQERVAEAEFGGPTKLSGVSGSGKTCIVVKRAIVLAERYPEEEILILTLNKPLANLIQDLVAACASEEVAKKIKVVPFFVLCQQLLEQFEPGNSKLYGDRTLRAGNFGGEHVDEIWREFYRYEQNNRDAEVVQPVHDSLLARGIDAEKYVHEEFDWIRSAVPEGNRLPYRKMERSGRSVPMDRRFRQLLLEGLASWEKKMAQVGVIDHLGIATALYKHREKLTEKFRCVLIDECQDFGTIELEIISRMLKSGTDNLFMCGDAAQHVTWKHQSLKDAGIAVPGARSLSISRNYRNSREILGLAYHVLLENMTEEMMDREDFEILDPDFANFSGPTPICLAETTLEQEIASALKYAKSELQEYPERKACIAFCGYSLFEIQKFGAKVQLPVLDGVTGLDDGNLFLSDLEQTKGFEFDLMCILNVSDNVIPDRSIPEKEQFRDLSRLYVAMTRAKLQLILSFSGSPSSYISSENDHLLQSEWKEWLEEPVTEFVGIPPTLDDIHESGCIETDLADMDGESFLFRPEARGLPLRLIEKIRELVNGESRVLDKAPITWRTLGAAYSDIRMHPRSRQRFGPEVVKEFEELCVRLEVS